MARRLFDLLGSSPISNGPGPVVFVHSETMRYVTLRCASKRYHAEFNRHAVSTGKGP